METQLENDRVDRVAIDALKACRCFGNDALHAGVIDLTDDPQVLGALFEAVNIIADEIVGRRTRMADLASKIPPRP
jgi:hypothetical protein